MQSSRRGFLKGSAMVGASVALDAVPGAGALESAEDQGVVENAEAAQSVGGQFTRGIGIYPGDPREDFSPELALDTVNYRNLALLRPAYHSSSYDYNLTAQLVTDGIKDTKLPRWISVASGIQGPFSKSQREMPLDHSRTNSVELFGANPTLEFELGGNAELPEVDRVQIVVIPPIPSAAQLSFSVSVSDDGRGWEKMGTESAPQAAAVEGYPREFARPGQLFVPSILLSRVCRSRFYRVEFSLANAPVPSEYMQWRVGEVEFYRGDKRVQVGGPYDFTSAWMSAGLGEEWVYVDLGAKCSFDRVKLYWIARAAEGSIQVSDDAKRWENLHVFNNETDAVDDVRLPKPAQGHYVRVLMQRPASPNGYILSEIEVYGRGGPVARHRPRAQAIFRDGRWDLAGTPWRLQRAVQVKGGGQEFSKSGFADRDWIIATVPGTALVSYLNLQAIPDPNFGKNQLYVSDSYFYSDFWYRTEFEAPEVGPGNLVWLNFDGINWKADIFLNGEKVGRIEGAFMRGRFDVTGKLVPGKNALAVLIEKNATPGSCKEKLWDDGGPNGGALGADNPTYHASVGWDWIPTIRGRNTGIIGDVYLTRTGAVTIADPFVTTTLPLPDTSRADVRVELDLLNHSSSAVKGMLRGRFGDAQFSQPITLDAGPSKKHLKLDPTTIESLRLQTPKLWWPVGYGEPNLYDVELSFEVDGKPSHATSFQAGVRQMTFSEEDQALKIWINGRRFIPRGGNWGFSESLLRFRKREYDVALRYHREMNFNMIRNWVGQVGDNAFYDACDRYGVMVWQDFWLANPWDGPNPADDDLFLSNAKDTLLRIRNHPCMGLYCGRNEGFPPKTIDDGLRALITDLHPGLHYIPNSAEVVVGGGGPYALMPLTYYPQQAAFTKLHSEIGIPNVPSLESVKLTLSPQALWPPGEEWGLHDLQHGGFFRSPGYFDMIENAYSTADNLEEFIWLAHFANYEAFRAEFEAQSKYRMGLLLWMSHCCWPSLLWQTYDYFFEPTPAYFACKQACEPLHVQWNRVSDEVEVVNYSAGDKKGLTVLAELVNMDGTVKWTKSTTLDSPEDSARTALKVEYPAALSPVHFVRLTLSDDRRPLSRNLYMGGMQEGNFRAIRQLGKAHVNVDSQVKRAHGTWQISTQLHNASTFPSLMTRLKIVRQKSGDRILPVIFDDNYVTLMPGERRTIAAETRHEDTRGESPRVVVEGFNLKAIP